MGLSAPVKLAGFDLSSPCAPLQGDRSRLDNCPATSIVIGGATEVGISIVPRRDIGNTSER
jgi:hypothetical protein